MCSAASASGRNGSAWFSVVQPPSKPTSSASAGVGRGVGQVGTEARVELHHGRHRNVGRPADAGAALTAAGQPQAALAWTLRMLSGMEGSAANSPWSRIALHTAPAWFAWAKGPATTSQLPGDLKHDVSPST